MPHGAKLLQWSTPLSNSVSAGNSGSSIPMILTMFIAGVGARTTPPNCGECSVAIPPAGTPDVMRRWPISWRGSISATFTAATTMQGEPILARSRAPLRNSNKHGFGSWLARAAQRLHPNVLAAALANKLARIAWTVLAQERTYETRVTKAAA